MQGWLGRAWGVDVEVSWMVRENLQGVSRMIPPLQAWWGWLVRLLFVESRWEPLWLGARFSGLTGVPCAPCFECTCSFSSSSTSSWCRIGFTRAPGTNAWPHSKQNPLASNPGKTRVGRREQELAQCCLFHSGVAENHLTGVWLVRERGGPTSLSLDMRHTLL